MTELNNKKEMSFEVAICAISKIKELRKKNGYNSLVVKFFGGEPLLSSNLIKKIVSFYETMQDTDDFRIYWAITTNGSLITEAIANFFNRHNFIVTISIDGTEEYQNFLRPARSSLSNSFDMVDNGIKLLKKHNVNFDLSAVLTDFNKENFICSFLDYAKSFEVREVKLLLAMQSNFLNLNIPELISDYLFAVYMQGVQKQISITGYWYNPFSAMLRTRKLRSDKSIIRDFNNSCSATDFQVSIEPNGNVHACKAMDMKLGNIKNFEEVLTSENFSKIRLRTYNNVPSCRQCEIEGVCQGECIGNAEHKFGDIYMVDKKFCDVYRLITNKLLINAISFNYK